MLEKSGAENSKKKNRNRTITMKFRPRQIFYIALIGLATLLLVVYRPNSYLETNNAREAASINGLAKGGDASKPILDFEKIWQRNQMADGGCILAISSYGNRNMTLNWIASLRKNKYTKFVILSFDEKLVEFLSSLGFSSNVILVPFKWVDFNVSLDAQDFMQGQFKLMMQSRVVIWHELLKLNKTFLACDTDLVFLSEHLYEHVKYAYDHSPADIIFSQDLPIRGVDYNTGFFFATPTDFVKSIMNRTLNEIRKNPGGASATDQLTLN